MFFFQHRIKNKVFVFSSWLTLASRRSMHGVCVYGMPRACVSPSVLVPNVTDDGHEISRPLRDRGNPDRTTTTTTTKTTTRVLNSPISIGFCPNTYYFCSREEQENAEREQKKKTSAEKSTCPRQHDDYIIENLFGMRE